SSRKRYVQVGLGSRSIAFTTAVLKDHADSSEMMAFCDTNQVRMDYWNEYYRKTLGAKPVPTYRPDQFEQMLKETKADCVIVTSIDRTHHTYITRAMNAGC